MAKTILRPPEPPASLQNIHQEIYLTRPIAIIDIGSNSVRMVVYRWYNGKPVLELNEKKFCELGSLLDIVAPKAGRSYKLPKRGKSMALATLKEFARQVKAREIPDCNVIVVATAAVRLASDGGDFVKGIARQFGWNARVLNATTEGVLAARGVHLGLPKARGLVVDAGGGSMQITNLNAVLRKGGGTQEVAALPLGALALHNSMKTRGAKETARIIDQYYARIAWLGRNRKHLVCVGGTFRKIGKLYLVARKKKDKLHGHTIACAPFAKFLKTLAATDPKKMNKKIPRRGKAIPGVALALLRLIKLTGAKTITFSKLGLREGIICKMTEQQTSFVKRPVSSGRHMKTAAIIPSRDINSALRIQL
ncbi:MAG: hypothetical protein GC131_08570 [Alphaproteobacteria bacterium]|nr:hypothetical protein [Alphaproteobacteria bacterium]